MTTALETGLGMLAHASVQGAVLALLVLGVSWTLGRRLEARWHFGLWLLVLVRLALPAVPPASWSLFQLAPPSWAKAKNAEEPVLETMPPLSHQIVQKQISTTDSPISEIPSPSIVQEEINQEQPMPTLTTAAWLALGWSVGFGGLLLRQGWLHLRLHGRRQAWHEVADVAAQNVFQHCCQELGVRRPVCLLSCGDRLGPATCGAFRSRILLPEDLLPHLSAEELRLVLLHELTHVRRWDVLLDRLATLLVAVHWFNPFAWLALARLRRERELACDEAVLRHLGEEESHRYGHVLLKAAEQFSARATLAGAVGVLGKDRFLVRRIQIIAHFRKPTRAARALGGLLLLVLGTVGLTDAGAEHARKKDITAPVVIAKGDDVKTATVGGVVQDQERKPLSGVLAAIYREDRREGKVERVQTQTTGDDGRIRFEVPAMPSDQGTPEFTYGLVLTKPGRGSLIWGLYRDLLKDSHQLKLRPAGTLQGRVTDAQGKPIAGVRVWTRNLHVQPIEGICSTRTDADGHYAITDMTASVPEDFTPKQVGKDTYKVYGGCAFDMLHPDYGHARPMYRQLPATVDVVLRPAGVIEGKVVDQVTGKPVAGVVVSMQGANKTEEGGWHQTSTDATGKYRFGSLVAGTYNLWAQSPDRACNALDSFAIEAGRRRTAPDLVLVEGGWIEGRLVEATTDKPMAGKSKEEPLYVGLYGPSRPKSGAACQSCRVDDQGRFRFQVAPGVQFPYLMTWEYWERTQRRTYFEKGIEVKSGEVVTVVFRILPTKPIPDPDPTPVRLPVPVESERKAAALVRQLGGWYVLDAENHVIEVNMVNHQTPDKRRFHNDRNDTDEALRGVGAFPRLKKLYLYEGQATDDGLRSLATLNNLEVLFVWDPIRLTDVGVAQLAALTKLRVAYFACGYSAKGDLSDASLAVFGRMNGLRELILYGHAFTDEGLKHLAGLKELRALQLGLNRHRLTDAGVRHLAGLTALEELRLQGAQLSDASVIALKDLKQLRSLYLNSRGSKEPITDASIEHLLGLSKLHTLWIQNSVLSEPGIRRLLALPELKDLTISSPAIGEGLKQELLQKRPGLQLQLSSANS